MHPACNAGGGGEKVLWSILISLISALKKTSLKYKIVIYSGETGIDKQTMMKRAEEKFNLEGLDSCID
jgi:alpha-1,2-mannosyltransferase